MFWRRKREQDLDRELRDHLELEAQERDRRPLGNVALINALDAVMWKSMPVRDPSDLRILAWIKSDKVPLHSHSGYNDRDPKTGQFISGSFSYPAYRGFRDHIPE